MGPLTSLVTLTVFGLAIISLAGLLVVTLAGRSRTFGIVCGTREALRRPIGTLVRSVPTALVAAVVLASLSVGDSLHSMVGRNTELNLSRIDAAVAGRGPLPVAVMEELSSLPGSSIGSWAPVIDREVTGSSERSSGRFEVRALALDDKALDLAPIAHRNGAPIKEMPRWGECYINGMLSRASGAGVGDWLVIELSTERLSSRSLLGMTRDGRIRTNLTVRHVIDEKGWGRFREDARSDALPILITNLSMVSMRLGWEGMSDRFLLDLRPGADLSRLKDDLDMVVDLKVAGYGLSEAKSAGGSLLWSRDFLFFPPKGIIGSSDAVPTLSYFVDAIRWGNISVPYSVVTGMGEDLGDDGIIVGQWLGDRLGLSPGDVIRLEYRYLTDLGTLVKGNRSFTVRAIVPQADLASEPALMPPIPGITEAASCSDWDPSFDLDLDVLTDEDMAYWEDLRTSPKAFISLGAAREMWGSHFGDTSALWFPGRDTDSARSELYGALRSEDAGISILDLKGRALSSSRGLEVFPVMFVTFGLPLLAGSVLVLISLERDLFGRRLEELSVMRALGSSRGQMASVFVWSAVPSALLGCLLGAAVGTALGWSFSTGLSTIWSRTVEDVSVPFSLSLHTVLASVLTGLSITLLTSTALSVISSNRVPVKNLRGEEPTMTGGADKALWAIISAGAVVLGAFLFVMMVLHIGPVPIEVLFIISVASISAGAASLLLLSIPVIPGSSLGLMVSSELSRRPGRYPLAGAILALALSLVLSMTAVSGVLLDGEREMSSGYGGGYELMVELTFPATGEQLGEVEGLRAGMRAVPLFTVGSEGGTCTNMNAVYPPRLIGVGDGTENWSGFTLMERDGRFGSDLSAWGALESELEGMVPILVDQNTLVWVYGKGLGDDFIIRAENGRDVGLIVIGVLSPSVLTGTFVMSSAHLLRLFPSSAGARLVLVDVPNGADAAMVKRIGEVLSDGLPILRRTSDLARENLEGELSYLALFRDMLLLSLFTAMVSSFAFVHARAVSLSRELSVMRAVGFDGRRAFIYLAGVNLTVVGASALSAASCALLLTPLLSSVIGSGAGVGWMGDIMLASSAFVIFSVLVSSSSSRVQHHSSRIDGRNEARKGSCYQLAQVKLGNRRKNEKETFC